MLFYQICVCKFIDECKEIHDVTESHTVSFSLLKKSVCYFVSSNTLVSLNNFDESNINIYNGQSEYTWASSNQKHGFYTGSFNTTFFFTRKNDEQPCTISFSVIEADLGQYSSVKIVNHDYSWAMSSFKP